MKRIKGGKQNAVTVLVAIIIVASAVLAATIIWSKLSQESIEGFNTAAFLTETIAQNERSQGNVSATVKLFVYTDPECPYCKTFHQQTWPQLQEKYGSQIFLAHRYLPLASRPKGLYEARAAECVYMLNGNEAFWAFIDSLFMTTPSNNGLDLSVLPTLAEQVGVSKGQYEQCMSEGLSHKKVQDDIIEASLLGLNRTPSFVLVKGDRHVQVTGDSYYRLDASIDYLLKEDN